MEYSCIFRNSSGEEESWNSELQVRQIRENQCEIEISGRGSRFYIIAGTCGQGNFICIPDWEIGSSLSSWNDIFWNEERLNKYMSPMDAITVAAGLKEAEPILKMEAWEA